MRDHCFGIEGLTLRRIADGRRTLRSALRPVRRYELHDPSGEYQVVTLDQMGADDRAVGLCHSLPIPQASLRQHAPSVMSAQHV
jgi:hypothetical protein